ncbi:hypothetical protein EB796_000265 [Bugula neritina]|uniref:Protein-PII uridylyltransferase N-terminal domain-containing protein n=1 Tax=Bugula neritina TaxID=10212 RepID=A0A7J7KTM7_BUGNE|nr:hypothetical protein EB796_000265 [Bugula neritina]
MRRSCHVRFKECGKLIEQMEMGDMFSQQNELCANSFVENVKCQSEHCTSEMIKFAKSICETSENLLGNAPCRYAVIALGSIARSEATPYSDLEYAFLIEPNSDKSYFLRLAVDTYFRISNLGETPLKYYYIEELYDNYRSTSDEAKEKLWFVDKGPSGFKIDGLLPKAGNIPTGNGLSENTLILTVNELMDRYISSVNQTDVTEVAGLSDLLFSTVLIHSHDEEKGGSALLKDFKTQKHDFETNFIELKIQRHQLEEMRMKRLIMDIKSFDYCPGNINEDMRNLKVKADIFRYPTIMAHNIRIALNMDGV